MVEDPYTLLAGSSGQVQRGIRRAVCSLFGEDRRFSFQPLVFPSVRPFSLARTTGDVLPLSSRKKFYNFRIALFRPVPFFFFFYLYCCLRASLSLHHPTFLFLVRLLRAFVFSLSRFSPRSIHPSPLKLLAFRSVSSLVPGRFSTAFPFSFFAFSRPGEFHQERRLMHF